MKSDSIETNMLLFDEYKHTHHLNIQVFYDFKRCTRFYSIQVVWCSMIPDFMFEYKWVYCYKSMSMECPFTCFREEVNCRCAFAVLYVCVFEWMWVQLKLPCIFVWNAFEIVAVCIRKYFRVTKLHSWRVTNDSLSSKWSKIKGGISFYPTPRILTMHSTRNIKNETFECIYWRIWYMCIDQQTVKLTDLGNKNNQRIFIESL